MEALLHESSSPPSKEMKYSRRKTHQHSQHQHQNKAPAPRPNILRQSSCGPIHPKYSPPSHVRLEMVRAIARGVFLNHFPMQFSLSSSSSSLSLPPILPTYHHRNVNQQLPPLLPLPLPVVPKPTFHSLPPPLARSHSLSVPLPRSYSLSSPAPEKQLNKTRLNSSTPSNAKKELAREPKKTTKKGLKNSRSSLVENDQPLGLAKGVKSDAGSVPKEMNQVLKAANHKFEVVDVKEKSYFTAASLFSLCPESPPPSSLPLPKFPLRKMQQNMLSCNAEAAVAEIDMGATENLHRLLKLR